MTETNVACDTALDGANMITIAELFRPVTSNHTVTDSDGNVWQQITATGYQRQCDKFFWPVNPLNNNNFLGQLPPPPFRSN